MNDLTAEYNALWRRLHGPLPRRRRYPSGKVAVRRNGDIPRPVAARMVKPSVETHAQRVADEEADLRRLRDKSMFYRPTSPTPHHGARSES